MSEKSPTSIVPVMMADYDFRELAGPTIHDQQRRPVCVAFAVSGAHEASRTRGGEGLIELAPEPIWSYNVARGSAGPNGMPMWDAKEAIETDGQPELGDWPFNPTLGFSTEAAPPAVGSAPWLQAVATTRSSAFDGVEADLEADLADRRAVAIVVETSDEFLSPDQDGNIDEPTRGFHGSFHAVVCLGAISDATRGRLLLIKNSWGLAWGNGGFGYVPISYLREWQIRLDTVVAHLVVSPSIN